MGRLPAERMTPIHELLARIRHDREFGSGRFEIGYFDRCEGTVHRVAFMEIRFPADARRVFELWTSPGRRDRFRSTASGRFTGVASASGIDQADPMGTVAIARSPACAPRSPLRQDARIATTSACS